MSAGHEGSGGILPEETLAIATAMADRYAKVLVVTEKIAAAVQGVPYEEESPEEQRATHLGRSALLLLRVENPSRVVTIEQLMDANESNYKKVADELSEREGLTFEAEGVKEFNHAITRELQAGSGIDNDRMTEDFIKQFEASKAVAEEQGVDVASVYADDDLYYEAARRANTPEETAGDMLAIINAANGEMMSKIAVQMLNSMLPKEALEEISQEEIDEMSLEMQLDPAFQQATAVQAGLMQEVLRQAFLYQLIRTYGYNAVNELSPAHKEGVLPKQPLAEEVSQLVRSSPA
jgi:hypothetical protein